MTDLSEVYARTRSLLAALGDSAESWEAAADYEEVLLRLDGIAPAARQPLVHLTVVEGTRLDLYLEARDALGDLRAGGVDGFELGICTTMLATGWEREQVR
jgi:hypothetical protein